MKGDAPPLTEENIRRELARSLQLLVGGCENTADVANMMESRGVRGQLGSFLLCPVAVWMYKTVPWEYSKGFGVCVTFNRVACGGVFLELPQLVKDFVREVDLGLHPNVTIDDHPYRTWFVPGIAT